MIKQSCDKRFIKKAGDFPRGIGIAGRKFARRMQLQALEQALAPCPRRSASLLEVNCGNGAFLHFLWECGFDVEACEKNPDLREKAVSRSLPGMLIHAALDNDLPFEDDSFDWIILHLKKGEKTEVRASVNEVNRVARKGILITFWNSSSLSGFAWRLTHKQRWADDGISWRAVWTVLHSLNAGRITTFSTLTMPVCLWKYEWNPVSPTRMPVGAWCIIRLEMEAKPPLTSLPLRLENPLTGTEPALEPFTNKIGNISADYTDIKK